MKLLITGGAGFVGANLAVYFAAQGQQVTALDNLVRRGSELNLPRLRAAGVTFLHGDIRCTEDWPQERFDIVLDTAAQPSAIGGYTNPAYDLSNNITAAWQVLEYCRRSDTALIFWASNKVYPGSVINAMPYKSLSTRYYPTQAVKTTTPLDGGDRSIYGATKLSVDLMIQEYVDAFKVRAIVNRFSCLAGPWQYGKTEQGWVAWWVIAHQLQVPLRYIGYEGKQMRDVLFVQDLCLLIERQATQLVSGGYTGSTVFNVGGGRRNLLSLRDCTTLCQRLTGHTVEITEEEEPRRADFRTYCSDIEPVCHEFAWEPMVSIEEGVGEIYTWVREQEDLLRTLYAQEAGR